MPYTPYVTAEEYSQMGYNAVPADSLEMRLKQASRNVDTLTYNRIIGADFDSLTEFQREIIKETVCQMADFYEENADALESVLQSYSINGVSMSFGESWNVKIIDGIAVRSDIYKYLCQTGLCCRVLR